MIFNTRRMPLVVFKQRPRPKGSQRPLNNSIGPLGKIYCFYQAPGKNFGKLVIFIPTELGVISRLGQKLLYTLNEILPMENLRYSKSANRKNGVFLSDNILQKKSLPIILGDVLSYVLDFA